VVGSMIGCILVAGGKGGVGKSTVSAGLARALVASGLVVGLLDADVSGPSQHDLFPGGRMTSAVGELRPALVDGVWVASMGYLSDRSSCLVWSPAALDSALRTLTDSLLRLQVGVLIVDLPPGAAVALPALAESLPNARSLFVTTGSVLAVADCRRDIAYHRRLELQPLGIVENFASIECPDCHRTRPMHARSEIDGLSAEQELDVLDRVPVGHAWVLPVLAQACLSRVREVLVHG